MSIAQLVQLSASEAQAYSTDCTISGGSNCRATFSVTNAKENFVVPAGITSIDVVVQGAGGGSGTSPTNNLGGRGAQVIATIAVTPGETLVIAVGAQGVNASGSAGTSLGGGGGGGGGSFVVRNTGSAPLVVAGGGGGGMGNCCGAYATGIDASTTNNGTSSTAGSNSVGSGGSAGNGGTSGGAFGAGAGGGFLTDGTDGQNSGARGRSWANGMTGGTTTVACASYAVGGNGGFGGGGAACSGAAGGGGGYSGGGGSGGSSNWGGGGGGGTYAINTASAVTISGGIQASNGSVTLTYINAPVPTSFTSAQTTPTKTNSSIAFAITFSQNVNSVANADFSNAGTASGCSFSISASSGTNFTLTISSCGEGTLIPQVIANSVFGTVTSTNGPSANSQTSTPITIDRTAPTISAALTGPSNATYIPGQSLTFTAPFSETVTVTGTPRLALTIGSTTRYADYASGSNSRTLTFTYVVQTSSGDIDADGIAVSTTLDLNSGAIADLATNALSSLTFTAPTLTSVLVAQTPAAPTITSITPSSGTLSVAFTAGATNGSAISNYQYSTNNGLNWTTRSPVATTSPIAISGLSNGTAYNVRLRAVNAAGAGDSSTAVSATPSAVVVSGDATLTSTYGQAASTGTYTSSGGTGPYTYALSASATGVTITSGVVTASASTPAGTYVRNVVSTDSAGTPQSGTKQLTITISKATTTITISLPGSATDAALGGAITITANVSQAGSVNFRLGGSTITGCGTVASSAGSATCSWTPGALGGASLTAVLTPTDSTNYENATTSTLSITVVNGVTSLSLSLAGGVTQAPKGQNIVITATVDQAGRISFFVDGKRIAGCFNKVVATSSRTCTWKPSVQKQVTISSRLVPTNSAYSTATESMKVWVVRRTGTR
jgi:hypothetical protein